MATRRLSPPFELALVLSTAHMPSKDPFFGRHVRVEPHRYGFFVFFFETELETLPRWLRPIWQIARENGVSFIVFDRDASALEALQAWNW